MNHAAPMMGLDYKDKENSKNHRRQDEEIRRDQLLQMAVEDRTPHREVWFSVTLHVLAAVA